MTLNNQTLSSRHGLADACGKCKFPGRGGKTQILTIVSLRTATVKVSSLARSGVKTRSFQNGPLPRGLLPFAFLIWFMRKRLTWGHVFQVLNSFNFCQWTAVVVTLVRLQCRLLSSINEICALLLYFRWTANALASFLISLILIITICCFIQRLIISMGSLKLLYNLSLPQQTNLFLTSKCFLCKSYIECFQRF